MKDLAERTAAVTGAAAGIGLATALALARRGMDVVLADMDEPGLEAAAAQVRALGRQAWAVPVDVSKAQDVRRLYEQTLASAGGVHVLVNNAGIARFGPALELSDDDWQRVIDVNLWGVIHGCRVFGPHFVRQGVGHIVNTASVGGLVALPTAASYVTAKFGVVGLSEVLRFELAGAGVGVTAVCPGFTKTSIAQAGTEQLAAAVRRFGGEPRALADKIVRAIQRDEPHVFFGPEPYLMTNLRRLSGRLYDRVGRALGAVLLKQYSSDDMADRCGDG